jgi:hypothetical protein
MLTQRPARRRRVAVVGLLALLSPMGVARAFTPTADDRAIHLTMGMPSGSSTPVPFQPFADGLILFTAGQVVGSAGQHSSFLADGVVGAGSAYVEPIVAGLIDATSVLDVRFELGESSKFSLQGSIGLSGFPFASATFLLERLAPSPDVLISKSGGSVAVSLVQPVGMPAGSYRLRAVADSSTGSGTAFFDVDFQRVCSSPDPQDSDGDTFVDACDVCPLHFDPDQADADADGIGDACEAPPVVPLLGPGAWAALALALLAAPAAARRRR